MHPSCSLSRKIRFDTLIVSPYDDDDDDHIWLNKKEKFFQLTYGTKFIIIKFFLDDVDRAFLGMELDYEKNGYDGSPF